MSAEENKALVRHYIEVVWNQRNVAALDELLAPNYQRYVSATAAPLSREGQRRRITGFHNRYSEGTCCVARPWPYHSPFIPFVS